MKNLEFYYGKSRSFDEIADGIFDDINYLDNDRGSAVDWNENDWPPKKIRVTIEEVE